MEARYVLRMRPECVHGCVSRLLLSEREGLFAGDECKRVYNSPELSYSAGLLGRVRTAILFLYAASRHKESCIWVSWGRILFIPALALLTRGTRLLIVLPPCLFIEG